MTSISSKEFVSNQQKYFDLALNERLCIEDGNNKYIFTRDYENDFLEPDMIFKPDEDFYKSISMEEVRERLYNTIDKLYASK